MSDIEKLSKLVSLREIREQRCLVKIAQVRARSRKNEMALQQARDGHETVICIADAQNQEAFKGFAKEPDPATVFARIATTRARGEAQIGASLDRVEDRRAELSHSKQMIQTAAKAHKESMSDLERVKTMFSAAQWSDENAKAIAEEDEISELYNSSKRWRLA